MCPSPSLKEKFGIYIEIRLWQKPAGMCTMGVIDNAVLILHPHAINQDVRWEMAVKGGAGKKRSSSVIIHHLEIH